MTDRMCFTEPSPFSLQIARAETEDLPQFSYIRNLSVSMFFHVLCFSFAEESGITYSMPPSYTRIPMYGLRA